SSAKYLLFLIKLKLASFLMKKIDRIFVGSIDNAHIHIHIHNYIENGTKLYTFDDGTANIFYDSFFYKDISYSYKKSLVRFLMCRNINLNKIKSKSLLHYSVFKNKKNIIDNIEYVNLFDNDKKKRFSSNSMVSHAKDITILIGQPIYESIHSFSCDKGKYKEVVKTLMVKYDIDYYFPHPREDFVIAGINYINTEKILEDYIISGLENGYRYVVYTFFSGAVIALSNMESVEIISLKLNAPDLEKYYSIMIDIENVKIIDDDTVIN
ncbi:glycosyltransferase family 52 protein, partial [Glaesserella parasuis]|nr:glycosyltransferase family 52 protein [Glaesserella parasuis]